MSVSLLYNVLLRVLSDPNLTAKGSSLTWTEEDTNFKILVDAIKELAAVGDTSGFEPYNNYTTYSDDDPDYVSYNGNIYEYINPVPQSGITPGTDPLTWQIASQGQFAHIQNTDQYLDFGGANQVSAAAIKAFIEAVYPYLMQGTTTLTEDLVFNLTVGTKVYSFQVTSAGIIISLIDSADSSNNAAVTIVDKKVQIIGSLQLSEGGVQMQTYPVYWRGDPATPQEGDIKEYYSEATDEIITEKYTSGVWTFRGSR